jgi:hypothetical protein
MNPPMGRVFLGGGAQGGIWLGKKKVLMESAEQFVRNVEA